MHDQSTAMERATHGQVTRFDLRPGDAHGIRAQWQGHAPINEQHTTTEGAKRC